MKYAASIEYTKDKSIIDINRPIHRSYLKHLLEAGNLFASGPYMDDSGALIVYEADSLEAAESFLKGDPFHAAGVFIRWSIRPWKVVMGNPALLPVL